MDVEMNVAAEQPARAAGHPGCHVTHETALAFMLTKNLAGSPVSISEDEFIAWAFAGETPDAERAFALREALVCMDD